jgi:hypothetical protein
LATCRSAGRNLDSATFTIDTHIEVAMAIAINNRFFITK